MVGSAGRWGLCWGVNRHWGEGWPRPQPHRGNVRTSCLANLLNIGMGGPPNLAGLHSARRTAATDAQIAHYNWHPTTPPTYSTVSDPACADCLQCGGEVLSLSLRKICQISHFFEQVSNTDGPPSRWAPEPPVPPSGGMQLEEPRPPLFISGWREKMQAAEGPSRKGQRRGVSQDGPTKGSVEPLGTSSGRARTGTDLAAIHAENPPYYAQSPLDAWWLTAPQRAMRVISGSVPQSTFWVLHHCDAASPGTGARRTARGVLSWSKLGARHIKFADLARSHSPLHLLRSPSTNADRESAFSQFIFMAMHPAFSRVPFNDSHPPVHYYEHILPLVPFFSSFALSGSRHLVPGSLLHQP